MASIQYERTETTHVEFSYEQQTALNECFNEAEGHFSEHSVKQCHGVCSQNEPHEVVHHRALAIVGGAMKNNTRCSLTLVNEHRWAGHFVNKPPHCINHHHIGKFLQTAMAFKGCKAAVVYAGKNCAGNDCAWLLAWVNTSHAQRVYVDCGPRNKFNCINWEEIKCKLERSSSKAKHTDCCTGTSVVAEIHRICDKAMLGATFSS